MIFDFEDSPTSQGSKEDTKSGLTLLDDIEKKISLLESTKENQTNDIFDSIAPLETDRGFSQRKKSSELENRNQDISSLEMEKLQIQKKELIASLIQEVEKEIQSKDLIKQQFQQEFIEKISEGFSQENKTIIAKTISEFALPRVQSVLTNHLNEQFNKIKQLTPKQVNFDKKDILNKIKEMNWVKPKFQNLFVEEIYSNLEKQDWNLIEESVIDFCDQKNQQEILNYFKSLLNSDKDQQLPNLASKETILEKIKEKNWVKVKFQNIFVEEIYSNLEKQNWSQIEESVNDFCDQSNQQEILNYFKSLLHSDEVTPTQSQTSSVSKEIILEKLKQMNWIKPKFQGHFVEEVYSTLNGQHWDSVQETIKDYCENQQNQTDLFSYLKSLFDSVDNSQSIQPQQQTLFDKEMILERIKQMNWIRPKFQNQFVEEVYSHLESKNSNKIDKIISEYCDQSNQKDLSEYLKYLCNITPTPQEPTPQEQFETEQSPQLSQQLKKLKEDLLQNKWVSETLQEEYIKEIVEPFQTKDMDKISSITQEYCTPKQLKELISHVKKELNIEEEEEDKPCAKSEENRLLKERIKNELTSNQWIQKNFLDNFHKQVFLGIVNQDWESIKQQIDDFCQSKNQNAVLNYLQKEFNEIKQQEQNSLIAQQLQKISTFETKSLDELQQIVLQLRQKGFQELITQGQSQIKSEVFRIEKETPFVYEKDLSLVELYTKEYSSASLKQTQLQVLLSSGFDNLSALNKEFTVEETKLYEIELQKPRFKEYISSILSLNFRQRLGQLLKCLVSDQKNQELTIDDYLFSETFHLQLESSNFEPNETINNNEVEVFFSNDEFQSFYIKCIILIEEENQSFQFSKTLNFIHLIKQNPQNIVDEIFNQQPNSDYSVFLNQIITCKQSGKYNQFVFDCIHLVTKDLEVKKNLIQRLFSQTLSSLQIAQEDVNDLLDQFVDHGLSYFYQSDHIDLIQVIIKQVEENLLLKAVFGKSYYSEDLKIKETYFNIQKGRKLQQEYDRMFHIESKISLEQFMKYDSKDYDPKSVQIKQTIESILSDNFKVFTEKIFNLIIQLSKRNQDLSPIFQELKSQLLQNKYTKYDISKKIVTEYLFKNIDEEVGQKMIYLIGYSNPIPFIISRPKENEDRIEQSVMKDALWLLSKKDLTVASIGFGYVRGKSTFLNEVFITSFDTSNKSFIYQGSADIQSNQIFKTNKRDYFVIDFHGDCLDVDDSYLIGFYNYRIFQITSAFLSSNHFQKVTQKMNKQEYYNSACYIVRDFSEAKPHYQEYFNVELVREKLGLEFFKNKSVILLPNLQRVSSGDRAFLIQKSREFLDSQIKKYYSQNMSIRQLYLNNENILKQNDPQSRIHDLIDSQLQNIIMNQQEGQQLQQLQSKLFILYPMFSRFQKTQLKLTKKHYLQKSSEFKIEETDLDKQYIEYQTMYQQLQVRDRSEASRLFENIIISQENLYNTMALFVKELKLVNDFQISGYIQQRRKIQSEIAKLQKQNQQEKRISVLQQEKQEIDTQIDETSLSVELFWRELMQYQEKDKNYIRNKDIINSYRQYIKKGFPFEIIDGDNFYFTQQFLKDVFNSDEFKHKKICVISIIGPQNSGKSTLLNYLLGCDFNVSDGRCTKGIYGTIIESKVSEFDFILVIDSEGLQSLEKNDPEYDRKITLFCLTVSHLVIINVKDQFQSDMLQLLEVCIAGRQNIQSNTIYQPIIEIIFNQTADPDLDNAQQAIDNAMQSLEKNRLLSEINTSSQNVTSLPSAVTSQLVTVGSDQEQWRYLKTQVDFVERVNKLGIKIINKLKNNFKKQSNHKNMLQWIDLAHCIYETIKVHPNLTAFKDIKEKQTVEKIQKYIKEEIDSHFTTNFYARLREETEKKTKEQSQTYIQKLCEEKKQLIISGYERMCKTIDFDLGDLFQNYRKVIGFSIDSKCHNYLNNMVIQKNNDLIQNSLDHCKYGVQKKMNELKRQGVSSKQAREEYKVIFEKELDAIQNTLPEKNQINLDILQFINDQYQLYYNHGLILLPEEGLENISKKETEIVVQQLNQKLMEITQQKQIFYLSNQQYYNNNMGQNNDITNFIFTNQSFREHIAKLKTSIINCDQIQKYYKRLKQLINLALSEEIKLINFTNARIIENPKKSSKKTQNQQQNSQLYQQFSQNQYSNQQSQSQNQLFGQFQNFQNGSRQYNNYQNSNTNNNKSDQLKQGYNQSQNYNFNKSQSINFSNSFQSQSQNYGKPQDQEIVYYEIDDNKIDEYNSQLSVFGIEIDKTFVKSQIESNIRVLDDRQKLILIGKEEFIKIFHLECEIEEQKEESEDEEEEEEEEEIPIQQTVQTKQTAQTDEGQIKKESVGWLKGKMQKLTGFFSRDKNEQQQQQHHQQQQQQQQSQHQNQLKQRQKQQKQSIQYWKPFAQWIRFRLQDSFSDIINIQQFVDNIKQNIEEKIIDKQVNEELIQSIQGYVNSEIKMIENNLEIFSIKFTKNFKSYIHTQTLFSLYFQEQKYRLDKQQKPINDFQHKQKDLLEMLMQKYDAKDDLNKISAIEFKDFIYSQANLKIQSEIQKELTNTMSHNEKNISKFSLLKEIELDLKKFKLKEANEYLTQPLIKIKQNLNKELNLQKEQITKKQKEQIQSMVFQIQDIEKQLRALGQEIQHQLSNNIEQIAYESVFQTFEIKSKKSVGVAETEQYQAQAFTEFIMKTLIKESILNNEIQINQVKFNIKLKQPPTIYLEKSSCNLIQELLLNRIKDKVLINDLTYFSKCFSDLTSDLIQKIQSIDIIKSNVEKSLNSIEQRVLNQCNETCPCCSQSCDQDHWKHQGVPIGEGINKHISQTGHRFVAFKGVKIERYDEPALIFCHDYKDDNIIVNNNQRMTWKEFKLKNTDWEWKFTDQDKEKDRAKWSYIWKLVGRDLCKKYAIKNYKDEINLIEIQNSQAAANSHFVFVFDESGSMSGSRFESLKQSLTSFIDERINKIQNENLQDCCSLIGFGSSAITHVEYELITPQLLNKIPNRNSGGGTSFSAAITQLNQTLSLNRQYDGNIVIAFLSDGESSFPERELDKLIEEYPNKIKQFLIVGFGGDSEFPQLKQMEDKLKEHFDGKFIQTLSSAELKESFEQLAFIIPKYIN